MEKSDKRIMTRSASQVKSLTKDPTLMEQIHSQPITRLEKDQISNPAQLYTLQPSENEQLIDQSITGLHGDIIHSQSGDTDESQLSDLLSALNNSSKDTYSPFKLFNSSNLSPEYNRTLTHSPRLKPKNIRNSHTSTEVALLTDILSENRRIRQLLETFLTRDTRDMEVQTDTVDVVHDDIRELRPVQNKENQSSHSSNEEHNNGNTVNNDIPIYVRSCLEQAQNLKISHQKEWQDTLNKRKFAFYKYLQNAEKAKLYRHYLESDPLYIPPKFKITPVPNETEQFRKLRENKSKANIQHEIEVMEAYSQIHYETYNKADTKMKENFKKTEDTMITQELLKLWYTDVATEEEKSKIIWKKHYDFLLNRQASGEEKHSRINSNKKIAPNRPRHNNTGSNPNVPRRQTYINGRDGQGPSFWRGNPGLSEHDEYNPYNSIPKHINPYLNNYNPETQNFGNYNKNNFQSNPFNPYHPVSSTYSNWRSNNKSPRSHNYKNQTTSYNNNKDTTKDSVIKQPNQLDKTYPQWSKNTEHFLENNPKTLPNT